VRIGIGIDAHRFGPARALVLGGVTFEHPMGLLGHSDADVLSHAVADALLGAAGLGDLGRHFPDSDPQWEGVSSLEILRKVADLLRDQGLRPSYVPRLALHREAIKGLLAQAIGVSSERVHVKGTTTEGMGFEGRREGISAWAVALVEEGHIP
jgi:2-C-methyl-D-erythritol 2,4-cyclodiphosphate synthase